MPPTSTAGNVLRPFTTIRMSMRLPPTLDAGKAGERLKEILESNPPYNCKVNLEVNSAASGFFAPEVPAYIT
jgi:hypothetical protein